MLCNDSAGGDRVRYGACDSTWGQKANAASVKNKHIVTFGKEQGQSA